MIRLWKGDPPIQHSKNVWRHWCRVLGNELTLIFFPRCPHCTDLEPDAQKVLDQMSVVILREGTA